MSAVIKTLPQEDHQLVLYDYHYKPESHHSSHEGSSELLTRGWQWLGSDKQTALLLVQYAIKG